MKVEKLIPLGASEHFLVKQVQRNLFEIVMLDPHDELAKQALSKVAKERKAPLTATDMESAATIVWELDEQYERAWHSEAWQRYASKAEPCQLELPLPIRKSK